jgi:photosystem II stability/assembly factor-like uncharacterized protein
MTDDYEDEIEALLRGGAERLVPPPDLWDSVRRRARRRKQTKGALAVAAAVVVIAGAVPAVIAVRGSDNGGNQPIQVANKPSHSAAPLQHTPHTPAAILVAPHNLDHLAPQSLSFVTQTRGWVSGETKVDGGTVNGALGQTSDAGQSWSAEPAKPAPAGLVRFATPTVGFSFGTQYQITTDGGLTWQDLPTPGYMPDLETMRGQVWALAQSCQQCQAPRLFSASLESPMLHRVRTVAPISPVDSALTLNGNSVFVTGGEDLWVSRDGLTWRKGVNPCGSGPQAFSAWGPGDLAAECTPVRGVGSLVDSNDGGLHWSNIANVPKVSASAGTFEDLVITTGDGAPYVTFDHGQHWKRAATGKGPVTFAAYISRTRIVGIRAGADPAFVSSNDNGRTWTVQHFAG